MKWTKQKPTGPGWWWCIRKGYAEVALVWRRKGVDDPTLYVQLNGLPAIQEIDDSFYLWSDTPVPLPEDSGALRAQ